MWIRKEIKEINNVEPKQNERKLLYYLGFIVIVSLLYIFVFKEPGFGYMHSNHIYNYDQCAKLE